VTPVPVSTDVPKTDAPIIEQTVSKPIQTVLPSQTEGGKVSALSLSSIRAKKEL